MINEHTLYFIDKYDITKIVYEDYEKYVNKRSKDLIEDALTMQLTTLSGRIDALRRISHLKNNVPLYINKKMLFFRISGNNKLWINYFFVLEYKKEHDHAVIFFKNGKFIKTNKNIRYLRMLDDRIKKMLTYIQK